MKKVKKRVLVLISIITFVLLIIKSGIYWYPILQGKTYSGDRININIKIKYNETEIDISCLDVKCFDPNDKAVDVNTVNSLYSVRGGKYGNYSFCVCIPKGNLDDYNEDILIYLDYINANNWYISNSDCIINIKTYDDVYKCFCEINTRYNDGTQTKYMDEKDIKENKAFFSWGI